jgi:hypothetical protein
MIQLVAMEKDVLDAISRIKEFLESHPDRLGKERAAYVIELLASCLGNDNPEEAELFKSGVEEIEEMFRIDTSQEEMANMFRETNGKIDRAIHPENYPGYERNSSFTKSMDGILFRLED